MSTPEPVPDPAAAAPPLSASEGPPLADMRVLFEIAFKQQASDIHLTERTPPMLRIHGALTPAPFGPLARADIKPLVFSLLNDRQKAQFERELELDLSIDVQGLGRFRVNVHQQRGSVEAAFRLVPSRIPEMSELGLPPVVADLTRKPSGLVLVTGPTGMGKTTTLASMVNLINHERCYHIVMIEDPIEYLHHNVRSIIKQREVYADTRSFANALVHALRQDPNVIVVGEMRDLETISTALTAAETGHLVLATLHTAGAAQTIDRILDVFPPHRQDEVKVQLSVCLQGVISQQLLPRCDRPGRVLACEIMIATSAVRNTIREHATEQIQTILQTGTQYGMCTMDASLNQLFQEKIITYDMAMSRVRDPEEFLMLSKPEHVRRRPWAHPH